MAGDKKKKNEGKAAKLAFRERSTSADAAQKRFSTHPEDIVKTFEDGRLLAKTSEGKYYFTTSFYTQVPLADPNRYGRPASEVSAEEATRLLQ